MHREDGIDSLGLKIRDFTDEFNEHGQGQIARPPAAVVFTMVQSHDGEPIEAILAGYAGGTRYGICADADGLWSHVLDRKGGPYRLLARMPEGKDSRLLEALQDPRVELADNEDVKKAYLGL